MKQWTLFRWMRFGWTLSLCATWRMIDQCLIGVSWERDKSGFLVWLHLPLLDFCFSTNRDLE